MEEVFLVVAERGLESEVEMGKMFFGLTSPCWFFYELLVLVAVKVDYLKFVVFGYICLVVLGF